MARQDPEELPYLGTDSAAELLQLADVTLVCKDGELPVHQAFLARGSKVGAPAGSMCNVSKRLAVVCRDWAASRRFGPQCLRVQPDRQAATAAGCNSLLLLPLLIRPPSAPAALPR